MQGKATWASIPDMNTHNGGCLREKALHKKWEKNISSVEIKDIRIALVNNIYLKYKYIYKNKI